MEEFYFPHRGMVLLALFIEEVANHMSAAPSGGAYIQAAGWYIQAAGWQTPETIYYVRRFLEEQQAAKIDQSVINKLKDLESE